MTRHLGWLVAVVACTSTPRPTPRPPPPVTARCQLNQNCPRAHYCNEGACINSHICATDQECGRGGFCANPGVCVPVTNPPENRILFVVRVNGPSGTAPHYLQSPLEYFIQFSCTAPVREIRYPADGRFESAPQGVFSVPWPEGCSSGSADLSATVIPADSECRGEIDNYTVQRAEGGQRMVQITIDCADPSL